MLVCACSPRDFKKRICVWQPAQRTFLKHIPAGNQHETQPPRTRVKLETQGFSESLPAPSAWLQVMCMYIYIHVYIYVYIYIPLGSNLVQLGATRAHQATDADQPMQVSRENLVLNSFRGSRTKTLSRARVFVCVCARLLLRCCQNCCLDPNS